MTLQSVAQITTPEIEKATSLTGTFHFTLTDAQSGTGQSALRARYPYNLEISKVRVIADAVDAGDTISVHTMGTSNTINGTIALNYRLMASGIFHEIPIKRPLFVQGSFSGTSISSGWIYCNLDSAGSTAKNITYAIEANISSDLIVIDLAEDTTTYTAQKGATFALGTALGDTLTTATGLTGLKAIELQGTAVNIGNGNWYGLYTARTNSGWDLSNQTTLHLSVKSENNDATMAAFRIVIWDGSGNSSYWDISTVNANSWLEKSATLASPDGNSGTAADLTNITKIGFVCQQPATAIDNKLYIDHIWAD